MELPPLRRLEHPDIAEILVYPDITAAAQAAADRIAGLVREKPAAVITYATGQTMIPVYAALARIVAAGQADFRRTTAFHLDERYPCPETNPVSFAGYIRERVLIPFGIPATQAYLLNGAAADPAAEASRYNGLIARFDVDLTIVGFGPLPGVHIGFNEQGTPFDAETHYTELAAETKERDRNRGEEVINGAITLGPRTIFASRKIIGIAYGADKGDGLAKALYGPVSPAVVASGLRQPGVGEKTTIIIDEPAAGKLKTGNL